MSRYSLLPVAVAVFLALHPCQLHAQAPGIACDAAGLPGCTGFSGASAPEDFVTGQPSRPNSGSAAASIGAILAQRRADKPVLWQAWSRATDDNARLAAQRAKANYNAMTQAMEQLGADTVAWTGPVLNGHLDLDFSLLGDVEARYEEEDAGSGRRRETLTRMSWARAAGDAGTFRLEEDGRIFSRQREVWTYRSTIQYEPASFVFYQVEETLPLVSSALPSYEAVALVGEHAFSLPMPPKSGLDRRVSPGAVYPTMLGLVITAMAGELPPSFTIWLVNEQGEVLPATITVVRELMVREPVGPAAGCDGATGTGQPRRAVQLHVSAGSYSHDRVVLADAPHLKVSDDLKCRIVR